MSAILLLLRLQKQDLYYPVPKKPKVKTHKLGIIGRWRRKISHDKRLKEYLKNLK